MEWTEVTVLIRYWFSFQIAYMQNKYFFEPPEEEVMWIHACPYICLSVWASVISSSQNLIISFSENLLTNKNFETE